MHVHLRVLSDFERSGRYKPALVSATTVTAAQSYTDLAARTLNAAENARALSWPS